MNQTLDTNEQTQKAFWINESKKEKQNRSEIKHIYDLWIDDRSPIKDDIKISICWICKRQTITNHQSTCLNCAVRYVKVIEQIKAKNKNCCSMCGNKRKLILDSNCCNQCLNSAFKNSSY